MDDIFFSDKPNHHREKGKPAADNLMQDNAASNDAFSGKQLRDRSNNFVVQLPQDEKPVVLRDRTPKGRPVLTEPVAPRVPDYQPTQSRSFDDSVYLRQQQPQQRPQPSLQQRPPQPRPVNTAGSQSVRPASPNRQPSSRQTHGSQDGKPKKKKTKGKVIVAILLVLFLSLTALFAYGYHILGKVGYDKDFAHENAFIDASSLASSPRVRNILCIGSDARGDVEGNRSDTMVLVSLDNAHHKIKMTSFLRDSYVYIPEKGYHAKLNAAFAWGGAKMLVDTIEYNFKVRIDDYVMIDFVGFQKLIDLMGGLDVDGVTEAEAKYMRDVVKIVYCKEGKNHFTGAASLWYCRIRKLDDDFHRTERQRKVINAIMKQALHKNPLTLMKIIEKVLPMIQTSISHNDLLKVGISTVFNYLGGKSQQFQIPAEDTWNSQRVNGQSVLKMDMEKNASLLKAFIY